MGTLKFKEGDFVESNRPWKYGYIKGYNFDMKEYDVYVLSKRNKTWCGKVGYMQGRAAHITTPVSIDAEIKRRQAYGTPYSIMKLERHTTDTILFCKLLRAMSIDEIREASDYYKDDDTEMPTFEKLKSYNFDNIYEYTALKDLKQI